MGRCEVHGSQLGLEKGGADNITAHNLLAQFGSPEAIPYLS